MGKMNISTARTKAYAKEQRTMNNEHYPKQTQSKPISPPHRDETRDTKTVSRRYAIRNTRYEIQTQSKPISNAQTPCPACQPKHCPGPGGLARPSFNGFPFRALRFATCLRSLLSVGTTRGLTIPPWGSLPPRRCSAEAHLLFPSGIIRFYPAAARALPAASRIYFSAGSLLVSRRCL